MRREWRDDMIRRAARVPQAARGRRDWFILRVTSQSEAVVVEILARRGITAFAPARSAWRRANRFAKRKQRRWFSLAPGYVFIAFTDGARPWDQVLDAPGLTAVRAVVGVAGRPAVIPEVVMARLCQRWGVGRFEAPAHHAYQPTRREYQVGDWVEVLEGPFAGLEARVEELTGARAKVLLTVLGGVSPVTVPAESLGAAA